MKNKFSRLNSTVLFITLIAFANTAFAATSAGDKKVVDYSIESVFCSGCVAGIKGVVGEIDGVVSIEVDVEEHKLTVVFEEDITDAESLMESITEETTFDLLLLSVKDIISDEG